MAITSFIPELWSAKVLTSLKKTSVFAGPGVVNRDYEGEIAASGDTVKITSVSRPTIGTYVKNSTVITPEAVTDAQRSLLIDQSKYFAVAVDDIDYRQSVNGGAVMTEVANEAAYSLSDTADSFVASLYSGVAGANAITTTSVTDAAKAVTGILSLKQKLDESNVPRQGRYVIVPPWYESLLLTSDLFARVDASGSAEGLRNGQIGRAFGFDVLASNNCVNSTGDDWIIQAGHPMAISFAEQIAQTEAYRPESSFSDALKGQHLYGAKLVRPTAIATLTASIT